MSKDTAAKTSTALAVIPTEALAALDKFAEENNLSVLTEGKGSFTAALSVATAIEQLKTMLTPEVMKPIIGLQGTALGFKTDKDKDGGYQPDVIRDVFIEATLKGFKMVGNQSNIIAGRFYATKEGFEDFFLRLAKKGEFTDFRDTYLVPKLMGDEAIVRASATWKWKGVTDKIENLDIPIRVNKGQGSDATLGKAKRKLLAKIYARVTGTVISEGDAAEPAIEVAATAVPTGSPGATKAPEQAAEKPDEATLAKLDEKLKAHADKANAFLKSVKWITEEQTYKDVTAARAKKILDGLPSFFASAGIEAS